MWLGLKSWHCTSMAQKTCCTRTVVFESLISSIKHEKNNHLSPNRSRWEQNRVNSSLIQISLKDGSMWHRGRVNKKPQQLLNELRREKLVYSESHKGTHRGVLYKTFTRNVTQCTQRVRSIQLNFYEQQRKRDKRKETGLDLSQWFSMMRSGHEDHWHTLWFMWCIQARL